MDHIVYSIRDPNEEDWKIMPCLFINQLTDTLFIKGFKGWLKIPTEYAIFHSQPERSKREDSSHKINPFLDEIPECGFSEEMRCSEHCGNTVRDK